MVCIAVHFDYTSGLQVSLVFKYKKTSALPVAKAIPIDSIDVRVFVKMIVEWILLSISPLISVCLPVSIVAPDDAHNELVTHTLQNKMPSCAIRSKFSVLINLSD